MNRRTALSRLGAAGIIGFNNSIIPLAFAGLCNIARATAGGGATPADDEARSLRGRIAERLYTAAFNSDGTRIATGGRNFASGSAVAPDSLDGSGRLPRVRRYGIPPSLRLWDAASGRELKSFGGHSAPILAAAFSPDDTRIVSGGVAGYAAGEERIRRNEVDRRRFPYTNFTGRELTTAWDGVLVKVWDSVTGLDVLTMTGPESPPKLLAMGRGIASLAYNDVLTLWSADDGRLVRVFDDLGFEGWGSPGTSPGRNAAANADGTRFVSIGPGRGKLWDTEAARNRSVPLDAALPPVALSPTGEFFLTWSRDHHPLLWDFDALKLVTKLEFGDDAARRSARKADYLAFSPDASRIVSCGEDGTLHIWDTITGRRLGSAQGPRGHVRAASFLADGRLRVASGGWETTGELDPETRAAIVEPLLVWDADLIWRSFIFSHSDNIGIRHVLFASHACYLDDASGAAVASRAMMQALGRRGFGVEALCGAMLDLDREVDPAAWLAGRETPFEVAGGGIWAVDAGGIRAVEPLHFLLVERGVPVAMHRSPSTRLHSPDAAERAEFLRLFDAVAARLRPEVLVTYGGGRLALELLARAKAGGAVTVFALHNLKYDHPALFDDVDRLIVPSRFAAEFYRRALGRACDVVPNLVDFDRVRVDRPEPRYVTFVNPSVEKGVFAFARIADELGRRRPDIPLLVVEARGTEVDLAACGLDLRRHGTVNLMANTADPRRFWRFARICLMPSTAAETQGLAAVEAMVNGIPVVASDRGALPETLGGAGVILPLPGRLTLASRTLPTAEEVAPWIDAIIRLWDDAEGYESHRRRALSEARRWAPDASESRLARFLGDLGSLG